MPMEIETFSSKLSRHFESMWSSGREKELKSHLLTRYFKPLQPSKAVMRAIFLIALFRIKPSTIQRPGAKYVNFVANLAYNTYFVKKSTLSMKKVLFSQQHVQKSFLRKICFGRYFPTKCKVRRLYSRNRKIF